MRKRRAAEVVLVAAAVALAGCATHMAAEPPAGVSLAGNWKLDPAASDDPQKLLDKMRAEAFKIIARQQAAQERAPPPPPARPGTRGANGASQSQDSVEESEPEPPTPANGHRPDPLRRSPMAHVIQAAVDRGNFLTVRQGAGEFVLDYGTSRRSFTPGAHSVVSAESGVGDQTSGWQGRAYVIRVRAQMGPDVTEEYTLSPDGSQLIDKLHVGGGELPAVDLVRIYRATTESAPRLPNSD
jgi:hypothetical protein